jgi:hypothetical protein
MEFTEAIQQYAEEPLTRQLILGLLKEYSRPYDKINELVKQDVLRLVKRGIYIPGSKLKLAGPEPFLLANHILGPSYISLETALSHWGLIPEHVYEISSVTVCNSKTYTTSAGRFSYTHLTSPYYSFGIQQLQLTKRQTVLIASPEKALCDKIIITSGLLFRSSKQVMAFLLEDLRIDRAALHNLNHQEISQWIIDAPKKNSLNTLVKTLQQL